MRRQGAAAVFVALVALAWLLQAPPPAAAAGPYACQGETYLVLPGPEAIRNGGFESGFTDWGPWANPLTISTTVVHSGSSSAKVDAVDFESTNTNQDLPALPSAYVLVHWFYLDTMGPGGLWGVALIRDWVPSTGAGDDAITVLVRSADIELLSWVIDGVSGVDQTVPFTLTPGAWHSLTVVADAARGAQCLYLDDTQIATAMVDPAVTFLPEVVVFGDLSWGGDAGIGYYDDLSVLPLMARGPGPLTTLSVGTPNYTAQDTWVTSSTPLTLTAVPRNGTTVTVTMYRVDAAAWIDYATTGPFRLAGEGAHVVEWYSEDNVTMREPVRQATLRVDNTPPIVANWSGNPYYRATPGDPLWITSHTLLSLTSSDAGVGLGGFERRVWHGGWSAWSSVPPGFMLSGEGPQFVEWRAWDLLGTASSGNLSYVVDDSPPTTSVATAMSEEGVLRISLAATDSGSGVARTEYALDGSPWTDYTGDFALGVGEHTILYRSIDRLGNAEDPQTYRVTVALPNWKPLVALIFVLVLLGVGAWSARRAPWAVTGGGPSAAKAFLLAVLPFLLAEAATGVVSLATGLLSIPPNIGPGTAVDAAILAAGIAVSLWRVLRVRYRASDLQSPPGPPGPR